jgi:RNA polymerase sigma-70 factor (ECF subfamily)
MNSIQFCEELVSLEGSLFKYALHLRLDHDDAKDLVQETFLKAIQSQDKFVDAGYLKAWTFTIMRNTFINNYRHNVMHKTYCDRTDESFFINQTKASPADNPDSAYSYKEISRSIEQLKVKFRVPFKMYIAGFKYREIADTTNLKVGTVKSRIFLARKVLMNHLSS